MDNLITLLPDHIANQIAAGEVIQRPASVIKELVENSIDAGATDIVVEIKQAGKALIQVIDNGKGMAPMDARMAFERHATSKIRSADDLFALRTMGFRGEALASIVAVAQVVLQTRVEGAEMGVRIELEGSKVTSSQPVLCNKGANFAVKNLFFNVPARRRFLKGDDTEFKHILSDLQRIAAVYPHISFTLRHDDRLIFKLSPTSLKQRVVDLFGKRLEEMLLGIRSETPIATISGFVGKASASRKRGALQYFFVNGRYMRHPYFHRIVMSGYEGMVPAGEQPEYFIYLDVAPASIDVNIHPTKTEIKFEHESDIGKVLYTLVRESLMKGASVPSIDFDDDQVVSLPMFTPMSLSEMVEPPTFTPLEHDTIVPPNDSPLFPPIPVAEAVDDWSTFYQDFERSRQRTMAPPSVRSNGSSGGGVVLPSKHLVPKPLPPLSPSGEAQVSSPLVVGDYAVVPQGNELLLMHIKRTRAKIIYEEYLQGMKRATPRSQRLIFPQLVELGVREARLVEQHAEALQQIGFDISEMGGSSFAINALPMGLLAGNEAALLSEVLEECAALDKSSYEVVYARIAQLLTQYRVGKEASSASVYEVYELLAQLRSYGEYPLTPEGKTILSLLTLKEIDKRF